MSKYKLMKVFQGISIPKEALKQVWDRADGDTHVLWQPYATANWQTFEEGKEVTGKIAAKDLTDYVLRGDDPLSDWLMDNGCVLNDEVIILL